MICPSGVKARVPLRCYSRPDWGSGWWGSGTTLSRIGPSGAWGSLSDLGALAGDRRVCGWDLSPGIWSQELALGDGVGLDLIGLPVPRGEFPIQFLAS